MRLQRQCSNFLLLSPSFSFFLLLSPSFSFFLLLSPSFSIFLILSPSFSFFLLLSPSFSYFFILERLFFLQLCKCFYYLSNKGKLLVSLKSDMFLTQIQIVYLWFPIITPLNEELLRRTFIKKPQLKIINFPTETVRLCHSYSIMDKRHLCESDMTVREFFKIMYTVPLKGVAG